LVAEMARFGVDVVSANLTNKGLLDPEQLLRAVALGRVLITSNTRDFLLLHQTWLIWPRSWELRPRPVHHGILLLHSAPGFGVPEVAREILAFLVAIGPTGDLRNRAFAWNAQLGWHEKF
jgi:hypothetical protein